MVNNRKIISWKVPTNTRSAHRAIQTSLHLGNKLARTGGVTAPETAFLHERRNVERHLDDLVERS